MRQYRSYGLRRPLTLRAFLVVSAVILAAGAIALSSRLSSDLHAAVLQDSGRDVSAYLDGAVAPARGKQFNPAVVDAFVAVSHRRPAEILPPEVESSAVAV